MTGSEAADQRASKRAMAAARIGSRAAVRGMQRTVSTVSPLLSGIIERRNSGVHGVLIKSADDKSKRLALLDDLQKSPLLDRRQREWLRDELHRVKRGMAGERDAAHYLDNYLKDDPDRMLLHDLRFKVDGDVIQIDHMVITRGMYVYLLETKNFNGNLRINAHGEFSVEYTGERVYGIPSPLEQSRRHEGPLRKLFDALEIRGRNGAPATIEHCVLVSPSSIIHRPPDKALDTTSVIKADQFRAWHEKYQDSAGPSRLVTSLLNFRSAATVEELARKLTRQHRPTDPLALPDFMQPRQVPVQQRQVKVSPEPVRDVPVSPPMAQGAESDVDKATPRRQLVCATCGGKISFAEGKFCWNNERRFGGLQYCRDHQVAFP